MAKQLNGKDFLAAGWKPGPWIGEALRAAQRFIGRGGEAEDALAKANEVREDPSGYMEDRVWGKLAVILHHEERRDKRRIREQPVEYNVCGNEIDPQAITQLENACLLPIAARGFLAPDAHVGYGIPIGGVLAARNAVIPWGVGVDIACRMKLTIIDMPASRMAGMKDKLANAIEQETRFGMGAEFGQSGRRQHDVMDDPDWEGLPPNMKQLKRTAWSQLGSSGSGNHFVEWGEVSLVDDSLGIPAGSYVALLSHSGSRGFGSKVAAHYSKLAMERCSNLPKQLARLAWLDMDTAEGQEYWFAMNLAGKYAAANHDCIHRHVVKRAGLKPAFQIENHHNFAWIEEHDGEELIVHRKGATPAGNGVLGIIPGSMAAPGFIVRGKGDPGSLRSASHGAGRKMSRREAKENFTKSQMKKELEAHGVTLISGGLDESPFAYKDIREVMKQQSHLVDTVGEFHPRIVKMAPEEEKRSWE